ncbi:MAG: hypothetical protein ACMUJM_13880 [bacterium]
MREIDKKDSSGKFTINAHNVQGVVQADHIQNLTQKFTGNQSGGIRAERIVAENVVDGAQLIGVDAQTADALIRIAKEIQSGGITAEEIRAKNLVSGLQYISDPANATPDGLRKELSVLREKFREIIKAGEIPDAVDVEDAKDALEKAETEAKAEKPIGKRIVRRLGELTEILTKSAETMKAGGNLKAQIIKLAPYAAAIWVAAQNLWR